MKKKKQKKKLTNVKTGATEMKKETSLERRSRIDPPALSATKAFNSISHSSSRPCSLKELKAPKSTVAKKSCPTSKLPMRIAPSRRAAKDQLQRATRMRRKRKDEKAPRKTRHPRVEALGHQRDPHYLFHRRRAGVAENKLFTERL